MFESRLKEIIRQLISSELKTLTEGPRVWKEGDPVTKKKLGQMFSVFHISNKFLGDNFAFTPRIPQDPWGAIEDDFTERVSLAPNIDKAEKAVEGPRPYIYAGDIKGYSGDEVETIDLAKRVKTCPKSPNNTYGVNFDLLRWLEHLDDTEQISIKLARKLFNSQNVSPKTLPRKLKDQFFGCVPDAKETKEVWSIEPVQLLHVANFNSPWGQGHNKPQAEYSLTEVGAKVFNAIGTKAETIPYD